MIIIIMSIRGRHIRNMEAGKKRFEMRKTRPGEWQELPVKVLLCQTGSGGSIVAEFTCPSIVELTGSDAEVARLACVTEDEVRGYRGDGPLYGWEITDFRKWPKEETGHIWDYGVSRSPQSWCYAKRRPKQSG